MRLAQLAELSGLQAETLCGENGKGKRCPLLVLSTALMKGSPTEVGQD
jgi:hypothetical protein